MARTFPRPANIVQMEWNEIVDGGTGSSAARQDEDAARTQVPLSTQVLAILAGAAQPHQQPLRVFHQ